MTIHCSQKHILLQLALLSALLYLENAPAPTDQSESRLEFGLLVPQQTDYRWPEFSRFLWPTSRHQIPAISSCVSQTVSQAYGAELASVPHLYHHQMWLVAFEPFLAQIPNLANYISLSTEKYYRGILFQYVAHLRCPQRHSQAPTLDVRVVERSTCTRTCTSDAALQHCTVIRKKRKPQHDVVAVIRTITR